MNDINWPKLFSTYSFLVEFYTEDEKYVARCMEFPAPRIIGASKDEALFNLKETLKVELAKYYQSKGSYPEPVVKPGYKEGPFLREMIRKASAEIAETPET